MVLINQKDVLNTIDDSGALNLLSEFTLPWDAAAWTFPKAVSDNSFWSQELKRLGSHNAR